MNRHFVKSDLLQPMICLMEEESKRDNMLSSACMDILEIIRKVSLANDIADYFRTQQPNPWSLTCSRHMVLDSKTYPNGPYSERQYKRFTPSLSNSPHPHRSPPNLRRNPVPPKLGRKRCRRRSTSMGRTMKRQLRAQSHTSVNEESHSTVLKHLEKLVNLP